MNLKSESRKRTMKNGTSFFTVLFPASRGRKKKKRRFISFIDSSMLPFLKTTSCA